MFASKSPQKEVAKFEVPTERQADKVREVRAVKQDTVTEEDGEFTITKFTK